jgi:hypothetical protein
MGEWGKKEVQNRLVITREEITFVDMKEQQM